MWCLLVFSMVLPVSLYAGQFDDIEPNPDKRYHVRLFSGDILIGTVEDISDDLYEIKLRTSIGIATIFVSQIAEIIPMDEVYPHGHRLFFMPTAEPVGTDFYLGMYELLMLSGGVGLSEISLAGGRTFVPGLALDEQASFLNIKTTIYRDSSRHAMFTVAGGGNIAWLNVKNDMAHLYSVGTWSNGRIALTGMIFAKVYGDDDMTISAGKYGALAMHYATGRVGAAVGFDMPVARQRIDLRFIGEVWCSDILHPERSALIAGLRLWNTDVAADFGLAFFPVPALAPVVNIAWTPRIRD